MNMIKAIVISLFVPLTLLFSAEDPFATPKLALDPEKISEVWMFTIRPDGPLRKELPKDYDPIKEYDEEMNDIEMVFLRFLNKEGIDFIGIDGSLVSISASSQLALTKPCLCHHPTDRAFIIIKQTKENLSKIKLIFGRFDSVKAEKIEIPKKKNRA